MPAPFDKFVQIPNFFYTTVGIQPYEYSKDSKKNKKSLLLAVIFYISTFNLNCHLLGEFVFVFMAFYTGTNFVEATVTAAYIGFVTVADCKMLSIWYRKKVLTSLILSLRRMHPNTAEKQQAYQLKAYLRHVFIVTMLFSSLYMLLIWTFNLFAVLQYTIYRTLGRDVEQYLPYNIYLPFDWRNTAWFYVLNVSQIIAGYTSAAGIISSDLLLCAVVTQVCMHYDYISRHIEYFTPRGGKDDTIFMQQTVLYHQKVLSFSDEINSVFGIPLLFNIAASSFIICFVGFQMTTGVTSEELFKYMLFLLSSLAQVYLICYYGQRISSSSGSIATALYNQTWYHNASTSYKKALVIMMQKANKPARLKATVFLPISLGSFTEIGQLSYKFFALLRTMYVQK